MTVCLFVCLSICLCVHLLVNSITQILLLEFSGKNQNIVSGLPYIHLNIETHVDHHLPQKYQNPDFSLYTFQ